MKKLVLFAVAAVALSFAACSNKSNVEATPENDMNADAVVEQTEEVVAPIENDSTMEVMEEEIVEVPEETPAE